MKTFCTIIFLLIKTVVSGQTCSCDTDSLLSETIDCKKIIFANKATLFWSFNCDSSWLTFESSAKKKKIIFSLGDGLQGLTGRLGHIYLEEFRNSFLVQNNVISGCCSPPEFYLYNKKNGNLINNLGRLIFYSEDKKLPFLVAVTNSSYNTKASLDYNSLTIYNVDSGKKYYVELPEGEIVEALKKTGQMYPEYLFSETILKGSIIQLTYDLEMPEEKGAGATTKTITIDLKKYGG